MAAPAEVTMDDLTGKFVMVRNIYLFSLVSTSNLGKFSLMD